MPAASATSGPAAFPALPAAWVALTGLCYASVWVSPSVFWPAAFVALFGIPLVLAGQLAALALGLSGKHRRVWLGTGALGLLLGYPFLRANWGGGPQAVPAEALTVLSYNLGDFQGRTTRGIDLEDRVPVAKGAVRYLADAAEVLMLQEVFNYPPVQQLRVLKALRKSHRYWYWSHHTNPPDQLGTGMAIFATYPLSHGETVYGRIGSNNQIIRADMRYRGRMVRLINVHLQSIRLNREDLSLLRPPRIAWRNLRRMVRKMRKAFLQRAEQVEALKSQIAQSPYPTLVAGDFNETPFSYTYWQISALMTNAFEASGTGWGGATYTGKVGIGLRIDQQFAAKGLRPVQISVERHTFSDHQPLLGHYVLE